jgi:hypothetical protein
VHLIIDAATAIVACIVTLWGKHQIVRKSRIAVKGLDALHNIPAIEFELFIPDLELLAFKRGPAWQFAVDNVIQFVDGSK